MTIFLPLPVQASNEKPRTGRSQVVAMPALGYKVAELKKIKKFFEGMTDTAETIAQACS